MDIDFSTLKFYKPEICLRPLTFADAQDIYEQVKHKEVVRYTMQIPHPYHLNDAQKFIKNSIKAYKKKTAYIYGIEHKDTKKIIGVISLSNLDKKNQKCELGYWLGKKYWNQGVMTKAVKMILEIAFNQLKMHRVYASTFADNNGSVRVLENNKFFLEGIQYETVLRAGKWYNFFLYGLLKDDFKSKK
jgi:RimJ/RimL family protein N-acetyltransferase